MYFKPWSVKDMVAKTSPKSVTTIEADRNVFSVNVDGTNLWDSYMFSIHANGDVTINDNTFSSVGVASQALRAIADFLDKAKK
jgi:hypothetical protein